jgi:SAM-dependent methyltransferase
MLWNQLKQKLLQLVVLLCCAVLISCTPLAATPSVDSNPTYQYRTIHSPDGIGKFYQGREIAKVMGHTEALWLERPSREREEQPQKVLDVLSLQPTDVVADIGAGTGYFSFRIAQKLSHGKVLAVDIQPEMLDIIEFLKKDTGITNVETILGNITNPNLSKNSINLALMVDAYHEFSYPYEVMQGITKALKPEGRVVLVEYRKENPFIPIKGLHKMSQNQVKKEMASVGLQWQETNNILPSQRIMIFTKPLVTANQ